METITAYEDLARLVTGHFHRGVRTNTMVSPEEYGPAIAAGTLRAQATPAGLLLLRDRGDHTRLTFYLGDLTVPLGAELPRPTVTEVAFRPRDTGLRERRESRLSPFLPRRRRRSPLCRPFCSPISPP